MKFLPHCLLLSVGLVCSSVTIQSLGKTAALLEGSIASIELLGGEPVKWEQTAAAVVIQPSAATSEPLKIAAAYRIRLE